MAANYQADRSWEVSTGNLERTQTCHFAFLPVKSTEYGRHAFSHNSYQSAGLATCVVHCRCAQNKHLRREHSSATVAHRLAPLGNCLSRRASVAERSRASGLGEDTETTDVPSGSQGALASSWPMSDAAHSPPRAQLQSISRSVYGMLAVVLARPSPVARRPALADPARLLLEPNYSCSRAIRIQFGKLVYWRLAENSGSY